MAVNPHLEIQIDNRQGKQKEDDLLNDLYITQSKLQWKGRGERYSHTKMLFHDVCMYTHKQRYVSGQSHHGATDLQKSNIQSLENLGIIELGIGGPHCRFQDSS